MNLTTMSLGNLSMKHPIEYHNAWRVELQEHKQILESIKTHHDSKCFTKVHISILI
jgi:hypothetical protein